MAKQLELQTLVSQRRISNNDSHERYFSSKKWNFTCPYLGILLATLSSLFFSLCSVIVKYSVDIHPMELASFR